MKNKFLIIIGTILIILVAIILIFKNNDKSYLKEITYNEYLEKVENKESFIFYVKQNGCAHCTSFTPVFESVLNNYKIAAYYINLSNLTTEENTVLKNNLSFTGTPTVMFFEDGIELGSFSRISGEKSKDFIIKRLTSRGYIK